MRRCASCEEVFADGIVKCPGCGAVTEPVPIVSVAPNNTPSDARADAGSSSAPNSAPAPVGAGSDTLEVEKPATDPIFVTSSDPSMPTMEMLQKTGELEPYRSPGSPSQTAHFFANGTIVGDRYRTVRPIGAGAMGAVYEVEDTTTGEHYALKLLHPSAASIPDYVKRLEREAEVTSRINHANIVHLHHLEVTKDSWVFIVLELLSGRDLGDRIREGVLSFSEAITLGIVVANALQAAHDEGVVHRDLKPENIFLAQEHGQVVPKVLDFGISKVDVGEQVGITRTGMIMGTPRYMSPEHIRSSRDMDARADIYSLGIILYEAILGRPPFDDPNPMKLAMAQISGAVPPMADPTISVPAAIEEVVLRCLQKEPDDRYGSMIELAQALAAAADACGIEDGVLPDGGDTTGLSIATFPEVRPPITLERPSKWPVYAGATALLVGIMSALWWWLGPAQ